MVATVATTQDCPESLCRLLGCASLVSIASSGLFVWYIAARLRLGLQGLGSTKLSEKPLAQPGPGEASPAAPRVDAVRTAKEPPAQAGQGEDLGYWKEKVRALAALDPSQLLHVLRQDDPFGTRGFEQELIRRESNASRVLSLSEVRSLFPCPPRGRRISLPDLRNHSRKRAFKTGSNLTWIFFQHLRKAGGTHFCTLAQRNLPKAQVPPYFCMPDWEWSHHTKAGYLCDVENAEIAMRQRAEGWRIAGNEWQHFERRFFELPGAIFSASFRKPLDRALSEYRFHCVEDRGCKGTSVENWWRRKVLTHDVYTKTFAGERLPGKGNRIWRASGPAERKQRGEMAVRALGTVARFNLVLVMEWLAYAEAAVKEALGFQRLDVLTERVRPHIRQHARNDNQTAIRGARSQRATWDPEKRLRPETYRNMSEELALDELLTDAARRLFLERLVCEDAL